VPDADKQLRFYVYNRKTGNKVFNMTAAQKVLIPMSDSTFEAVIVAEKQDATFKLEFSVSTLLKAAIGLTFSLATILMF